MPKTILLNTSAQFGYYVNTTVVSSALIDGGTYYDDQGNLQHYPPIGTKVYPASMSGIEFSEELNVDGVGTVLVTGTGSDGAGAYFTYSQVAQPAAGAYGDSLIWRTGRTGTA